MVKINMAWFDALIAVGGIRARSVMFDAQSVERF